MIKTLRNRRVWNSLYTVHACNENLAVQGFDTSVKSLLFKGIGEDGAAFHQMSGTDDGENVAQLYNDKLDFPAQAQADFIARLREQQKQTSDYYNVDNQEVNTTDTSKENVANEDNATSK